MEFPVTVTSQDEFDTLVRDRLARERQKFADYDELKTRAEQAEAAKTAAEQALTEAVTRAETAEGKVATYETEKQVTTWRDEVAKATGVPAAALRGSTKEEFEAHAETLKPLLTAPRGPVIPTQGTQPDKAPENEERAFVGELFGSGAD